MSADFWVLDYEFVYVERVLLWLTLPCGKSEDYFKVVEVSWLRWHIPTAGHVNLAYLVLVNKDDCGPEVLSALSDPTWRPCFMHYVEMRM